MLGAIGSALVAVGILPLEVAASIADDYSLASELRNGNSGFHFSGSRPPRPPPVIAPLAPVVAICERVDPHTDGSIPYAVLGDCSTELAVTYNGSQDWQTVAQRFPNPAGFPHSLQMTDDTGRSLPANFSGGGGGNGGWVGRFETHGPLSQHTRWLELGGMRLNLARVDPPAVTVEQLPRTSAAADFLLHRAAADESAPPPDDDPVITALIATGVLAADDPVLDDLRAIAGLGHLPPGIPPAMRRRFARALGPTQQPGGAAPQPPGLPEPWRSLGLTGSGTGPAGLVLLGAATPVLEGTAAVVYALTSDADGFRVDTRELGGQPSGHFGQQKVDPTPSFAWWARDDRGGTYRGQWQGWGGSETERRGDIHFAPPLDPRARSLQLTPTVRTCRAVIDITLPEWSTQQ